MGELILELLTQVFRPHYTRFTLMLLVSNHHKLLLVFPTQLLYNQALKRLVAFQEFVKFCTKFQTTEDILAGIITLLPQTKSLRSTQRFYPTKPSLAQNTFVPSHLELANANYSCQLLILFFPTSKHFQQTKCSFLHVFFRVFLFICTFAFGFGFPFVNNLLIIMITRALPSSFFLRLLLIFLTIPIV